MISSSRADGALVSALLGHPRSRLAGLGFAGLRPAREPDRRGSGAQRAGVAGRAGGRQRARQSDPRPARSPGQGCAAGRGRRGRARAARAPAGDSNAIASAARARASGSARAGGLHRGCDVPRAERRPAARSSRTSWWSRPRWRSTCWAGRRESATSSCARTEQRAPAVSLQAVGVCHELLTGVAHVDWDGRLGRVRRVWSSIRRPRRRSASDPCGGRPTRSPARAAAPRCGTASRRRTRTDRRANRLRARRSRSPLWERRELPQRGRDLRRGVAVLNRGERPHEPSCPSAAGSPASRSSRAFPRSPVTTPIVRGSSGRSRRFCGSKSPSAASFTRSRWSAASRSPSPAIRSSETAKLNEGEEEALPG